MTDTDKIRFSEIPITKDGLNAVAFGICSALAILPLALSISACSPFGAAAFALPLALLGCAAFVFDLAPSYIGFSVLCSAALNLGTDAGRLTVLLSGIGVIALTLLSPEKRFGLKLHPGGKSTLLLLAAIWMTVMQTTNYFGIGAHGTTITQMLAGYRYLGFHGNWRGVLYGTIVMVVMITYPRKFKKLSQKLPAGFFALLFTLSLNLFLNPDKKTTAIAELCAAGEKFAVFTAPSLKGLSGASPVGIALYSIAASLLAYFGFADKATEKKDFTALAAANIAGAAGAGFFTPCHKNGLSKAEKAIAFAASAAICTAVLLLAAPLIGRIPLPSAAVILIVGAWQQVTSHGLKSIFTGGIKSVAVLIASAAAFIFLGTAAGIIICITLSIITDKLTK